MIYTNLFKPNKAAKAKSSIKYLIESRKYKFSFIFEKKAISMMLAMVIGGFLIITLSVGTFALADWNNKIHLDELTMTNNQYNNSVQTLQNQEKNYLSQKTNIDNIYNISEKSTKWSSIMQNVSEQLPYDAVLVSLDTIGPNDVSDYIKNDGSDSSTNKSSTSNKTSSNNSSTTNNTSTNSNSNTSTNSSNNTSTNNNVTNNTSTNNNVTNNTSSNNTQNNNSNSNTNTNTNANTNSNTNSTSKNKNKNKSTDDLVSNSNNVIAIQGKSLSMVNISLFLDKLDSLQIFSKVECTKAANNEDDSDYYDFTIFAYLN